MVNLFINCIMFNKENCSWFDLNLCLMLSGLNNFHFKCILALLFGCSFSGQKNQRTINEFLKDVVKKMKEAVVCQGDIMFFILTDNFIVVIVIKWHKWIEDCSSIYYYLFIYYVVYKNIFNYYFLSLQIYVSDARQSNRTFLWSVMKFFFNGLQFFLY